MRTELPLELLAETGALLTRGQGKRALKKILDALGQDGVAIIDVSKVTVMSPSFADELFGGLDRAMGSAFRERVHVRGASADLQRLIGKALSYRRSVD